MCPGRPDPALRPRTAYLVSTANGCQSNLLESALFRRYLAGVGYALVQRPDDADVIVVNTCGFSAEWARRSADEVAALAARFPAAEVIAAGCLPRIEPGLLDGAFEGARVGPGDVDGLHAALDPGVPRPAELAIDAVDGMDAVDRGSLRPESRVLLALVPAVLGAERLLGRTVQPLHNLLRSAAFHEGYHAIAVASGCEGHCTYCAIRRARGRVRSVAPARVEASLARALAAGRRDVWLVAEDLGCWGADLGLDLADLLGRLLARPDDFRLVINYVQPRWLLRLWPRLGPLLADPRVINVNVPMQSGSPDVLRRMGRDDRVDDVRACLATLRREHPALVIKTHLMVGFPGETEPDVQRTLELVDDVHLVVPFAYTRRPGTPAADLPGVLPRRVIRDRERRLRRRIRRRYLALLSSAGSAAGYGASGRGGSSGGRSPTARNSASRAITR